MDKQYMKPVISQKKAAENMHGYLNVWIAKWLHRGKRLETIELVYLPYSIFPYKLQSNSTKGCIEGFVGIETYDRHSVILPVDQERTALDSALTALPAGSVIGKDTAYDVLYSEAFLKEKGRSKIQLEIKEPFCLYVPYWVGHLKGKERNILVVDGLSGKVDMKLNEPIIKAFLKEATLSEVQ